MSLAANLCKASDDKGECSSMNATSISHILLSLSKKRPGNKEELSKNDAHHPSNESDPGNKTAIGAGDFVVDLEPVDEVQVSVPPHKRKRRHVVNNKQNGKNDTAKIMERVEAIEKDVWKEGARAADHHESHEGIIAAEVELHPMNSDSERTCQDDGSTDKYSQKPSTSRPPVKESGRQSNAFAWDLRLSELAEYRKLRGHCNVPQGYSDNIKLATWVANQRRQYRFHLKGKTSSLTAFRIQKLESLGFECRVYIITWGIRLRELDDYCKIHGHCNVPCYYTENPKLATWVQTQRSQYKSHLEGEKSHMTSFRIQKLESLGFEFSACVSAPWEVRLSELADFCKLNGHCNVPQNYSENPKLANWVGTQRNQYKLRLEGKASQITTFRIQELESVGFEWKPFSGWRKGAPLPGNSV
jgi:hypothetical protein